MVSDYITMKKLMIELKRKRQKYRAIHDSKLERPYDEVATQFCGMDDGVSNRMDRTKALGNAIVPQIALEFFKGIDQLNKQLKI